MTIGGFTTNGAGGSNVTEFTGGGGSSARRSWIWREVLGVGLVWTACIAISWIL